MSKDPAPMSDRRQRIHELVIALLARQAELELLDGDGLGRGPGAQGNPAGWLERNHRILQHYQALVRTAATLDALVEQEAGRGGQVDPPAPGGTHRPGH